MELYFYGSYHLQLRSLPEMRMDANAHHLMANDELLLTILLAFVPRLLNTQFTRSQLDTPDVFAMCVVEQPVVCTNSSPGFPHITSSPLQPARHSCPTRVSFDQLLKVMF
jgi:hypothetical protein